MRVTATPEGESRLSIMPIAGPSSLLANRVLVVRLSAMGDIIHAMPAVSALRQAKPDIQIGWLVEERWAELLCSRDSESMTPRSPLKPLVDWVHLANFKSWRKGLMDRQTWAEIGSRRRQIRRINYGLTLDLQGAIRSSLAARATGASIRLGSSQPREGPARMFYTKQVEPGGAHVVDQALALVSAIAGEELRYADPLFPVDPAAEAWADQLCGSLGSGPLAILNPGAGWERNVGQRNLSARSLARLQSVE